MKDQPWNLNQTWPVGRKWCWFTNASEKFRWPSFKFEVQKHQILDHFFCDFRTRHRISPEWNVVSTNKNASVNLQCVPYKLTYFPWPLIEKRLRSVCIVWHIRRPLRCNHQSCDISSTFLFFSSEQWAKKTDRNWHQISTPHLSKQNHLSQQ